MEIWSLKDFGGYDPDHLGSRDVIGHVAIGCADPVYPTREPNRNWISRPVVQMRPFEIFTGKPVGRWSVLSIQ